MLIHRIYSILKQTSAKKSKEMESSSSNSQPKSPPNEIFVLFDFSCGRFYTHHSGYLRDYSDFLVARNKQPIIWVNTSADRSTLELFDGNVKAILRSNSYSHDRRDNLNKFTIDFLVNKSAKLKIAGIIRFLFLPYYLRSAVREFKTLVKLQLPIKLVIPTLDGLALRFIKKILSSYSGEVSLIAIRLTAAERRGIFGYDNAPEILRQLTLAHPDKIRIGFEVKALEAILIDHEISRKNIFWAPIPFISRKNRIISTQFASTQPIKLGFLGSARPNKGFDSIPDLLNELESNEINFNAFIQLPNFEWDGYENTLNRLNEQHSKSIKFIPSGIDKSLLNQIIGMMDLIILPYKLDTYKISGSGILFIACDYGVPLAATKNLAFTWDIEQFETGFSFANLSEFSSKIKLFNSSRYRSNISIYNEARVQSNLVFLNLE